MKDQKGFSLIEVVIAVALLGIIAVGFLGALGTASKALFTADERETAKNLAESQMEYVKQKSYIDYSEASHDVYGEITPSDGNYSIDSTAVPFDPDTGQPYSQTGGIFDNDDGIQKITVKIYHHDDAHANPPVLTLEGYKVDR